MFSQRENQQLSALQIWILSKDALPVWARSAPGSGDTAGSKYITDLYPLEADTHEGVFLGVEDNRRNMYNVCISNDLWVLWRKKGREEGQSEPAREGQCVCTCVEINVCDL